MAVHVIDRWKRSVVFKLGVAMSVIVILVALLQSTVGLQIYRLGDVQSSINTTSVPLLQKAQRLARTTARNLSLTILLEGDLTVEELSELQRQFLANQRVTDQIVSSLSLVASRREIAATFESSRIEFFEAIDQMFSNQFEQRAQEAAIADRTNALRESLDQFQDRIDRMLVVSASEALTPLSGAGEEGTVTQSDLLKYRTFASEIETLNTLKSNALGMSDAIDLSVRDTVELENELKFRLRSIGQTLILLRDSPERISLAQIASDLNAQLSAADGLITFLQANAITRANFQELRKAEAAAVENINNATDLLVSSSDRDFQTAIGTATSITSTILWIGIATTILVLVGIVTVNRWVIRKQISERFTLLTEDVLAISNGDYGHEIRVDGIDEIGDIAKALDQFKEQAAELQRSNAELEKFAYVAAHDLRSPLDAIQDLARWTLEDEREHLSSTCIENLELLLKRSARLSALQSDLLTYAKVGQINIASETFSLKDEVSKAADMLDPDNKFNIRLENDPGDITTYGLPTRQILLNLVTNAIKHHDKSEGEIVVRYQHGGSTHIIAVEDDGPGIEPRYQKKVFELFKTLQSRDTVEGSGLGLALVNKLITQLNGRLTIHSDAPEQRGCKFVFEVADLNAEAQKKGVAA